MGESDADYRARMKEEKVKAKADKKAKRDAKARAGNPRSAAAAAAEEAADTPSKKKHKTAGGTSAVVPALEINTEPDRRLSVDTGEPGLTPKIIHQPIVDATTPLSEREAQDAREKADKSAKDQAALLRLASHCLEVATLAEEQGGFVATKGGMPLVGMVARIISTKPEIGAKNLYKQVCETLGSQPNRGKAPNSREVRKIVTALKEDKGLDMVMSFIDAYTPSTMRAKLIAKKIEEGPKSEDGAVKLFMGNLDFQIQNEEDSETIREFFKDIDGGVVDICLLKNEEDRFAGTGFVEFKDAEATKQALALHGSECGGREIILHYAKARKPKEASTRPLNEGLIAQPQRPRPEGCTVVFVGNLRFDVDTAVVKAWASECGEVTGIRWLNDRHTGNFKGCGYIEFGAKSADSAVDAIVKRNGELIMGRPVRVDYAEDTRVAGEGNAGEDEEQAAAAKDKSDAAGDSDSDSDSDSDAEASKPAEKKPAAAAATIEGDSDSSDDGGSSSDDDDSDSDDGEAVAAAKKADGKVAAAAALKEELKGMKLRALQKRAEEAGVDEEKLDEAEEKEEIIALIIAATN